MPSNNAFNNIIELLEDVLSRKLNGEQLKQILDEENNIGQTLSNWAALMTKWTESVDSRLNQILENQGVLKDTQAEILSNQAALKEAQTAAQSTLDAITAFFGVGKALVTQADLDAIAARVKAATDKVTQFDESVTGPGTPGA